MLKRLGGTVDPKGAATSIKDAEFPAPFASELEFNSPVHGTWNIVHTGMHREIGTKAESGFSVYCLFASFPGQRS